MKMIMNFLKDEEGAVFAEYAILLVVIAVVLVATMITFRTSIEGAFNRAAGVLNTGDVGGGAGS